ncbi:hypothetical protein [Burkholderia pyrrocinia]|uniref:hypothetical protein n=1 Tax=Burkholderia pyrrocinia TaxID=60550 RepID=UPI001374D36F|nr:hypothetical protein [Burkholderia pyrrocinia]
MHDPRRPHRSVARDPIVHGLSKREKKKKQAKCREFVECLQSTTASRVRLHGRIPPSYPVEYDCPPNPPGAAIASGIACVTFGFFAGHSIASSRVGRLATHDITATRLSPYGGCRQLLHWMPALRYL